MSDLERNLDYAKLRARAAEGEAKEAWALVKSYQESNDKVRWYSWDVIPFLTFIVIGHGGPAIDECQLCVGPRVTVDQCQCLLGSQAGSVCLHNQQMG